MNGDLFRAKCKHYMELRHIRTLEQLRSHTTVSNKTFLKYWHNPDMGADHGQLKRNYGGQT